MSGGYWPSTIDSVASWLSECSARVSSSGSSMRALSRALGLNSCMSATSSRGPMVMARSVWFSPPSIWAMTEENARRTCSVR